MEITVPAGRNAMLEIDPGDVGGDDVELERRAAGRGSSSKLHCHVALERGDERHGGEHGPGFEGFEPEAGAGGERSRAAACAAGWGLRGKQASEASEWGSRPMAAGRHGGDPGGWGGRRESDARSQASHGRGGEYENGGAGGVKSPRMRNG